MTCPLGLTEKLPCALKSCWMHHAKARCKCMILDAGTAEITEHDIARVNNTKLKIAQQMVADGRDKIAAWLKLVEAAEDTLASPNACDLCGKDDCEGGVMCRIGAAEIARIAAIIPLGKLLDFPAGRWRALLNSRAALVQSNMKTFEKESKVCHEEQISPSSMVAECRAIPARGESASPISSMRRERPST